MMSKGRDVGNLFPDVVKNVVCQNVEVKRLVYIYLTHYAEIEPEPALLGIFFIFVSFVTVITIGCCPSTNFPFTNIHLCMSTVSNINAN